MACHRVATSNRDGSTIGRCRATTSAIASAVTIARVADSVGVDARRRDSDNRRAGKHSSASKRARSRNPLVAESDLRRRSSVRPAMHQGEPFAADGEPER